MEPNGGSVFESSPTGREHDDAGLKSLQFREEIHRLISAPPENGSSFTALLELPPTQVMELLHSPESDGTATTARFSGKSFSRSDGQKPYVFRPCNDDFIERAAKFSVFDGDCNSGSSVPSNSGANLEKVKEEPAEADSSPNMLQPISSVPSKNHRAGKRKERTKKVKGSIKKSKSIANESSGDAEKLPYVHVRARRGQATDRHSLAERARREKINARMKLLQELVPGCNKISGTALVLDEIINHVQSLQRQVELLSMKLVEVNPRIDFNLDNLLATEGGSLVDGNIPGMGMPFMWPEISVTANRQQYQHHWNFDVIQQPLWGREGINTNFMTSENPLLSYNSSANSVSLHSDQLKMEL